MCGISGILSNQGVNPTELKKMTDIIRHRGPDGEGYVFFKGYEVVTAGGNDTQKEVWTHYSSYKPNDRIERIEGNFSVGFGHRRLAIIDLSANGHIPMSYQNQRYWITYNGEIYNYKEIRDQLTLRGYEFNTHTDTEVILASYAEWGIDCMKKFNGMWAFAIYDTEEKIVFMSRDRFGIKPFYYWFSPNGDFAFASEIKQFTKLSGWSAKINPARVYDYLVYSFMDHTDETMFDNVYQIPGGHYYKCRIDDLIAKSERKIIPLKWYDLTYCKYPGSFTDATIEFNHLFKSSIDIHLRADVLIGSALSGGLDSSAIVCEVNNILRNRGEHHLQKTFSACCFDTKYDEKKWVDIVVAHTSVDAHFIYPKLDDIFDIVSKLTWQHDEPFQSLSPFMAYYVFQAAARNGVKVLLNGQGADEYLGGYGQFALPMNSALFQKLKWFDLIHEIRNSLRYTPSSYSFIIQNLLSPFVPQIIRRNSFDYFGHVGLIKSLISTKSLEVSSKHPYDVIPMQRKTVQDISKLLTFYTALPKYLKWEDRNSMANSIEARVPFLDYRLVEFSYNLPDNYLNFHGETKKVLREGLKNLLPDKIRSRKDKVGFISPEERWVKTDNPELFRTKLREAIEIADGIINKNALSYFDKVISGKVLFDYTYWRLIQFSVWLKEFDIHR